MNKILGYVILVLSLFGPQELAAQDNKTATGSFSLTTNPVYFGLGGYHIKPAFHFPQRWSVALTLQGGFELPEIARDSIFSIFLAKTFQWIGTTPLVLKLSTALRTRPSTRASIPLSILVTKAGRSIQRCRATPLTIGLLVLTLVTTGTLSRKNDSMLALPTP